MIIFFSDSRRGGEHIAKGKMDPRVALIKVTASKSYQKLINSNFDQTPASKSRPDCSFKVSSVKKVFYWIQDFDQTSASKSRPNFTFKILTTSQAESLEQSYLKSISKSLPDFCFDILAKIQVPNLYQASASKFLPKYRPTRSSASKLATQTTSRSFELASS